MDTTNGTKSYQVALVDDHPIVRTGLKYTLGREPDLTVCLELSNIREALLQIPLVQPDIAIVDLRLPDGDGMDLIKDLRLRCPNTRIIVLTFKTEPIFAERALSAGARGYVTKETADVDVIRAIRDILKDDVFVSEPIAGIIWKRYIVRPAHDEDDDPIIGRLSDRELQVLELTGQGLKVSEMADLLNLSAKTIHTHRRNMMIKLGLNSSSQLFPIAQSLNRT